ncbi:acyltransferase [Actinomyces trachealis]|uniref:acyltransferase n=1 Tax=Actinomyces trachealis TaxID=2763540 RepID=UPI0018C50169|nr:acyltransferase [Actinomyces trachealis]
MAIADIRDYEDDRGNRIIGKPVQLGASSIRFYSENCVIEFERNVSWLGGVQFLQAGSYVKVGSNSNVRGGLQLGTKARIVIGEYLDVTGGLEVFVDDGATVDIGKNCLFATRVALRSYDSHPIFDLSTKSRINYSRNIVIGDHVWLGAGVTVLGGSTVGNGAIVGTASVITKSTPVPPDSIVAGVPAKIVRSGIAWVKPGNPPVDSLPDDYMTLR